MTKVGDAYIALLDAMTTAEPLCKDDDLFTADNITKEDAEFMASLCRQCPLLALCKEYAQLERPKAGYWAGKRFLTTTKADSE